MRGKFKTKMKIHILGICGTFMGGIAVLAKQLGHQVSGCDANVYPPMSTQLEQQGITLIEGFDVEQFNNTPDLVIIGNAMTRGNPAVEYVLNNNIPYTSGPAWLAEHVLQHRHVVAVAGTHGKTTTSSMLAWVLEYAGFEPGFLIGGVPENFSVSSRLGSDPYFVIEADEYDSAFFDKRSKFIHYHSRTLILNNLEYDHADIFPDLAAIQTQFHHLVRTVPEQGVIIYPQQDQNLRHVLEQGCWSQQVLLSKQQWHAKSTVNDNSEFDVFLADQFQAKVQWDLIGEHNQMNAVAVFAAAHQLGINSDVISAALNQFKNVKRRMQHYTTQQGINIYDDFAHHPTSIAYNLVALRHKLGKQTIIAAIDLGSFTMRTGVHRNRLLSAIEQADQVLFLQQDDSWQIQGKTKVPWKCYQDVEKLDLALKDISKPGDNIVLMSNRGFNGLLAKLQQDSSL